MISLFALLYLGLALTFGGWWWLAAVLMSIVWIGGKIVDARLAYWQQRLREVSADTPLYSPQDPDQES